MNISWQRGKFIKFYAKVKIRVGGSNPIDIQEGDEFEYDGSILKYAGAEIPSPQARGAVKEGWVTTSQGELGGISAVSPTRNVAKATSVNRDLSRVQRGPAQHLETDSLDEETVLDVAARRPNVKADPRAQPRVMTKENNHRAGMRVEAGMAEQQEGVTVGRVRTAASFKGNVYDASRAGVKEKLENLTGSGFIPNGKTVQKEGVSIKTNVGNVDRSARVSQDDDGRVVGNVRHTRSSSSEGVDVRDTSNIRNEKKAGQNGHPKPASKPAAKAAPAKIDTSVSPKIRAARRVDPSFPADWSFSGKLAERLDRVREHGATPVFLEALYAAEGDQMRKLLEKEFPKQFG